MNDYLRLPHDAPRLTLRHVVSVGAILLLIVGIIGYIGFQGRYFLLGPQIYITEDVPFRSSERTVTIGGTTRNITHITLNGRQIFTNPEGVFRETVVLGPSINTITISARDRYGRVRSVERTVVFYSDDLIQ